MHYKCEMCPCTTVTRTPKLSTLPPVLVLHLKRYVVELEGGKGRRERGREERLTDRKGEKGKEENRQRCYC